MSIARAKNIATDKGPGKEDKGRTKVVLEWFECLFLQFLHLSFLRAEISLASWTAGNGFLRFALAYYLFVD